MFEIILSAALYIGVVSICFFGAGTNSKDRSK